METLLTFEKKEFDEYDDYVTIETSKMVSSISVNGEKFEEFLERLFYEGDENVHNQVENMFLCRRRDVWLKNGTYTFPVDYTCDNRMCPHCSKLRSIKQNRTLRRYFKDVHKKIDSEKIRFLTLTYKSVKTRKELEIVLRNISKDMIKFRRQLSNIGYDLVSGYRVTEITWNEKEGFHPHLHLLYFSSLKNTSLTNKKFNNFIRKYQVKSREGKILTFKSAFYFRNFSDGYIDYELLKQVWKISNHQGAFVSRPELIKHGINAGINYICKYMTKGFFDSKIPIIKSVDIYIATQKSRFIQKFGITFKGFKVSLYKVSMFYKDDVHVVGATEKGFPIYEANIGAIPFYYGFSPHLDIISKKDIIYCEV